MVGKLRWNFYFALGGMLIIFLLAWSNNPFHTALIRSMYAFAVLFIIMFAVRYVLAVMIGIGANEKQTGAYVDLRTPEDDTLEQLLKPELEPDSNTDSSAETDSDSSTRKEQGDDQFQPMNPPKLVTKESTSPEQLAHAIRQLSDKEGR